MPPTVHAVHGASSSKRWMNCPGSIALSEGMPDQSSKYAIEGTAAHEVVEETLARCIDGEDVTTIDMLGRIVSVFEMDEDGNEIEHLVEVTEEMATAAQVCVDHALQRVMDLREEHGHVEIWLERTFDLAPINAPVPMFGTADITLWVPSVSHLETIDYKHGQGVVVEATENSQLMVYVLGATVSVGKVPATCRATIVQPRADHHLGPIRDFVFHRERLIEFKNELFAAAEATLEEDAPLAVGDWCKFCKAKAVCPAQLEHAQGVALVEFDIQPEEELADLLPNPALLSAVEVSRIVDRASIMMDWLRDVESYALTQLEQGNDIPGYKMVAKKTNRRWRDNDAVLRMLARRGLKIDERTTRKVIGIPAAEKALKARGIDPSKLEKFWEKPEGQPKLARTDDPRPELPASVDADFGALTEPHPGAGETQDDQEQS